MKINLSKNTSNRKRFIGLSVDTSSELLEKLATLEKSIIVNNLRQVSPKIYLELNQAGQMMGVFKEVIGVVPVGLQSLVYEFEDVTCYLMDAGRCQLVEDEISDAILKLWPAVLKIVGKIQPRNYFLSFDFDKIELHFFV